MSVFDDPCHVFQDEKQRIEGLGGSVIYWGTWRVNGQLAVSRAIGKFCLTFVLFTLWRINLYLLSVSTCTLVLNLRARLAA